MFGKKEESFNRNVDTIIGDGTQFSGELKAKGTLRIDGKFNGQIEIEGDVIIGKTGQVYADIKAENVTASGDVHGNLILKGKLELHSTAKLYGDIEVSKLIVNEGAVFKGQSKMNTENEDEISKFKKDKKKKVG